LVEQLVSGGHQVLVYDHRDVGRSTKTDPNRGYRVVDLARDLFAIVQSAAPPAHIVGRSMGGAVALQLALDSPEMVRSLSLIGTSACLADPHAEGLGGPSEAFIEASSEAMFAPPPKTDEERLGRIVAESMLLAGPDYPTTPAEALEQAKLVLQHGYRPETGHAVAVSASPSLTPHLGQITKATLVIHGTADPVLPLEHAHHLVEHLPNATLMEVEGLGHDTPPALCRDIAPRLLEHFAATAAAN